MTILHVAYILFSIEVNSSVSYLAQYIGIEGKLEEIRVQWNEMVRKCNKTMYA